MRESASRGFWVSSYAPFGYNRVMVQDGPKKRPTLELDPDASRIVKRIFDMAEAGNGMVHITKTLNDEGVASPRGKLWGKTSVHAIITKAQFGRVGKLMRARAPKTSHPRRVGSTYLLSELVKCKACNRALSGQDAKSGQFAYYVMLVTECTGAAESVGLDFQMGFFHRPRSGRPSLALDLAEEFRALTHRFVVSLIRRRQVGPDDFDHTPGGGVYLSDGGRIRLIEAWEGHKETEIRHQLLGRPVGRWALPSVQATLLARNLRGDLPAYPPFVLP